MYSPRLKLRNILEREKVKLEQRQLSNGQILFSIKNCSLKLLDENQSYAILTILIGVLLKYDCLLKSKMMCNEHFV